MESETKPMVQSKMNLFNAIFPAVIATLVAIFPGKKEAIMEIGMGVQSVVNVVLRTWFTNTKIGSVV